MPLFMPVWIWGSALGSLSAKAVDYIRSIGGIGPYGLLQVGVNPSSYSARLVRIDLTADFIDECFTVQEIYDGLNDGSLHVMREHLMFALGRLRSGKRRSRFRATFRVARSLRFTLTVVRPILTADCASMTRSLNRRSTMAFMRKRRNPAIHGFASKLALGANMRTRN